MTYEDSNVCGTSRYLYTAAPIEGSPFDSHYCLEIGRELESIVYILLVYHPLEPMSDCESCRHVGPCYRHTKVGRSLAGKTIVEDCRERGGRLHVDKGAKAGSSVADREHSDEVKMRKILSLDGGGVRGLSIIMILKYIMKRLDRTRGFSLHP